MTVSKRPNDQMKYSNRSKTNIDLKNKDLRRSNCFNCDFSSSNFNETSFRGAQFKSCNFSGCTFDLAELVATNLKNSRFKQVNFKHTLFDHANLEGVDFEGATFENVIFVETDLSGAKNLNLENQNVKIFEKMPELEISKELEKAVEAAMKNEFVKYARILDTKEGKVNPISVMILLEVFSEEVLIKGLKLMKKNVDKDIATLSMVIEVIKGYQAEELV